MAKIRLIASLILLSVVQFACITSQPQADQLSEIIEATIEAELQDAFVEAQEELTNSLRNEYERFVENLRADIQSLYRGALDSIRNVFSFLSSDNLEKGTDGSSPFRELVEGPGDFASDAEFSPFGELLENWETEERQAILDRAAVWVQEEVSYSTSTAEAHLYQGMYRRDCSGFVTYAWQVVPGPNGGLNTDGLRSPEVTHPIAVADLKPGDILITIEGVRPGHVLIFAGWEDEAGRIFSAFEQVWGYYGRAVKRIVRIQVVSGDLYIPEEGENGLAGEEGTGPYEPRRYNAFP